MVDFTLNKIKEECIAIFSLNQQREKNASNVSGTVGFRNIVYFEEEFFHVL